MRVRQGRLKNNGDADTVILGKPTETQWTCRVPVIRPRTCRLRPWTTRPGLPYARATLPSGPIYNVQDADHRHSPRTMGARLGHPRSGTFCGCYSWIPQKRRARRSHFIDPTSTAAARAKRSNVCAEDPRAGPVSILPAKVRCRHWLPAPQKKMVVARCKYVIRV